MDRERSAGHESNTVPDVVLERYVLRELAPADADRVARLVAADPALRARVDALEQSDAEIRRTYPPEQLAASIRARVAAPHAARSRAKVWLATAAVAASAVVLAISMRDSDQAANVLPRTVPGVVDGVRIKGSEGGPALAVYRRTKNGSAPMADGDVARAGDLIRVGYTSAGRNFGVIVSLDGRGSVTVHLPPNGAQAARLKSDGMVLLDQAYELDEAPRYEAFYFITAQEPFEVAPILDAARKIAGRSAKQPPRLPIAAELEQVTFSLQKETGR